MTVATETASPSRVAFKASLPESGIARAWGYLDTKSARVGVVHQHAPQPHLTFYPPVRVPQGGADGFLDACLAHLCGGREEWGHLSVDPVDGEVSLRANLVSSEGAEIERALDKAAAFFDGEFDALARACLGIDGELDYWDGSGDGDGAEDGAEGLPDRKGLLGRFLDR